LFLLIDYGEKIFVFDVSANKLIQEIVISFDVHTFLLNDTNAKNKQIIGYGTFCFGIWEWEESVQKYVLQRRIGENDGILSKRTMKE
jgi:hypothetical protein